jgi:hypothetical protein
MSAKAVLSKMACHTPLNELKSVRLASKWQVIAKILPANLKKSTAIIKIETNMNGMNSVEPLIPNRMGWKDFTPENEPKMILQGISPWAASTHLPKPKAVYRAPNNVFKPNPLVGQFGRVQDHPIYKGYEACIREVVGKELKLEVFSNNSRTFIWVGIDLFLLYEE